MLYKFFKVLLSLLALNLFSNISSIFFRLYLIIGLSISIPLSLNIKNSFFTSFLFSIFKMEIVSVLFNFSLLNLYSIFKSSKDFGYISIPKSNTSEGTVLWLRANWFVGCLRTLLIFLISLFLN